jgi:hypothetical protein
MAYDEYNGADAKVAETSIEQDMQELSEVGKAIFELVERRYRIVDRIQEKHHRTNQRMQSEADWYEGTIRGNPVPDRNSEVSIAPKDPYTEPSGRNW